MFLFTPQEDIDSMQKELNIWKDENKEHEKALKAEQRWYSHPFFRIFVVVVDRLPYYDGNYTKNIYLHLFWDYHDSIMGKKNFNLYVQRVVLLNILILDLVVRS